MTGLESCNIYTTHWGKCHPSENNGKHWEESVNSLALEIKKKKCQRQREPRKVWDKNMDCTSA